MRPGWRGFIVREQRLEFELPDDEIEEDSDGDIDRAAIEFSQDGWFEASIGDEWVDSKKHFDDLDAEEVS